MESKNCKCFACGKDLVITSISENSRIIGKTYDGNYVSIGANYDNTLELSMRCIYCCTEYKISGFQCNLNKIVEW